MLRVDINILFTVINLLFLYFLMKRFLFKPVRAILEAREQEIQSSYKNAENANEAAQELKNQYEATMANIETERQQRLDATRLAASKEYDEIIANAREKAGKIISDAKIEAQKEAEAKQHEMQEQMAILVAQAAYKIAATKDSSENDSKLYDAFLDGTEQKR